MTGSSGLNVFGLSGGTPVTGWPTPPGPDWTPWNFAAPRPDQWVEVWLHGWRAPVTIRRIDLPYTNGGGGFIPPGFWWREATHPI